MSRRNPDTDKLGEFEDLIVIAAIALGAYFIYQAISGIGSGLSAANTAVEDTASDWWSGVEANFQSLFSPSSYADQVAQSTDGTGS
jgi:hypothetical protein